MAGNSLSDRGRKSDHKQRDVPDGEVAVDLDQDAGLLQLTADETRVLFI